MGKIIRNGISFGGGSGGSDIQVLTQEAYDALVTAGTVNDDVYYFIEDGEGIGNTISIDVLDTMAEITANTEEDKIAGALAVKELDNAKAPKQNPTLTFDGFGTNSNKTVELRRNGSIGKYEVSLVTIDAEGNKTFNSLLTGDAVRNWVTPSELETLKTSFQDGCSTIAGAITEMGVTTANNATPATMAANIKKITTGEFEKIISNVQATKNGTSPYWTITSYLDNYKDLTIDNFVIQLRSVYQNGTGNTWNDQWAYTYDASNGRISMYVPDTFGSHNPPYADIYYINKNAKGSSQEPSTGSGVTITNYIVQFNCGAFGNDATGISRYASSAMTLNVSGYNRLAIGSYTLSYDSDHAAVGNDNATLTVNVDGVSQALSPNGGNSIDVSNASSVTFNLNLNNAWVGTAFGVWGSITISSITLS